jgi:hypothetical protein
VGVLLGGYSFVRTLRDASRRAEKSVEVDARTALLAELVPDSQLVVLKTSLGTGMAVLGVILAGFLSADVRASGALSISMLEVLGAFGVVGGILICAYAGLRAAAAQRGDAEMRALAGQRLLTTPLEQLPRATIRPANFVLRLNHPWFCQMTVQEARGPTTRNTLFAGPFATEADQNGVALFVDSVFGAGEYRERGALFIPDRLASRVREILTQNAA